jgi:hypothetical protein
MHPDFPKAGRDRKLSGRLSSVAYVSVAVPLLVAVEMLDMAGGMIVICVVAAMRHGAVVSVVRIEVVIHVSMKVSGAMKPRAGANKHAAVEPLWTVIAVWGAVVRRPIVVAVWTHRCGTNVHADAHLRLD